MDFKMLKSLIIKILAKVILILGVIFKRKRVINLNKVKKVLVNRSDVLGDAIVSLPLLIELNKQFEITVLTSSYNDYILKDFFKTKIFTNNEVLSFLRSIQMIAKHILRFDCFFTKKSNVPKYDLCLDLVGIRKLDIFLKIKKQNLCCYYIGFNLGIWNLLLDYSDSRYPALFSKTHILDSYRRLLSKSLGLNLDISDYIDLSSKITKPSDLYIESPYILVNISGSDKFRGPTPQMFAKIINQLDFKGKIVIMDELDQPNLKEFKKHIERDNIMYLERNYSIWELVYISGNSILYIGSNSGITQILEIPTNCLVFFATTSFNVWKPYSKNFYQRKKVGELVIEETKNSQGLIKKIIYQPVWCRPCFDLGCRRYRCIKDMNTEIIADEIKSTLEIIYGD